MTEVGALENSSLGAMPNKTPITITLGASTDILIANSQPSVTQVRRVAAGHKPINSKFKLCITRSANGLFKLFRQVPSDALTLELFDKCFI